MLIHILLLSEHARHKPCTARDRYLPILYVLLYRDFIFVNSLEIRNLQPRHQFVTKLREYMN